MKADRNVVITGRSVISPLGDDIAVALNACYEGRSSFEPLIDSTEVSNRVYTGRCGDLDQSVLPDKKVRKSIVRRDLIGLIGALKAAVEAKITKGSVDPDQFGIYVGSSSTQIQDLNPYYPLIERSFEGSSFNSELFGKELLGSVNPLVMLHTLMNNTLCYASIALDIRGVNGNFMDFQSAGSNAVIEGFHSIREGRAKVVLAGGVSGCPEPYQMKQGVDSGYLAFEGSEVSSDNIIRPYSSDRCGTILSEGSAFLVLEEEEHALSRGAKPIARLSAVGKGSDASFAFLNDNRSKGLVRCLQNLANNFKLDKAKLGLVFGHGNGSVHGDMVEYRAYQEIFEGWDDDVMLTSPKASLGEMGEASAVASLILASEVLNGADVIPIHNFMNDTKNNPMVNLARQNYKNDQILITSRGFSGLCCALMLERV